MCAIPQLVSVPLNSTPIAEHFRTLYVRRRHIWNCFDNILSGYRPQISLNQLLALIIWRTSLPWEQYHRNPS